MAAAEVLLVWVWAPFAKEIVKYGAKALWVGFNWASAANKLRENLYRQYSAIQIFGQPEPVALEGIFTHVYALDKPTAWQRYNIEALREIMRKDPSRFHDATRGLGQRDVERIEGLKLVTDPENDRLFVLGKPGAGKTTFLKYLTLQAAKKEIDKIPIFVSLRAWADSGLELMPFLGRQFEICKFPEAEAFVKLLLDGGLAMVLFDGLDEVGREAQERMRLPETLTEFSQQYHKNQVVVTCRVAATDYIFEGFKYVEIADFHEGQMWAFVRKWFKGNDATRDSFWEELYKEENQGLRELGRTPLLLALLCLAFQETLTFPQRRVEIYEEALDALLKKWDRSRKIKRDEVYRKLSLGRKRQMLAQLAAGAFGEGEYFFQQRDLENRIVAYLQNLSPAGQEEDIDGEAVLKAMEAQHGILVERAHRIHAFAHPTFQEYFTAKYVVENAREGTIPRLLAHCTDARWREVILLSASLLADADALCQVPNWAMSWR